MLQPGSAVPERFGRRSGVPDVQLHQHPLTHLPGQRATFGGAIRRFRSPGGQSALVEGDIQTAEAAVIGRGQVGTDEGPFLGRLRVGASLASAR